VFTNYKERICEMTIYIRCKVSLVVGVAGIVIVVWFVVSVILVGIDEAIERNIIVDKKKFCVKNDLLAVVPESVVPTGDAPGCVGPVGEVAAVSPGTVVPNDGAPACVVTAAEVGAVDPTCVVPAGDTPSCVVPTGVEPAVSDDGTVDETITKLKPKY
jgi:hypothetical protein